MGYYIRLSILCALSFVIMTLPSILTASGVYSKVSTIAGDGTDGFLDGPALNAKFKMPQALACDIIGNVYVSDTYNNCVRKLDVYSGEVTTINGWVDKFSKIGKMTQFNNPRVCEFILNETL